MAPQLAIIYQLIVAISGNDGNFRMQFDFYGKMQPFILFWELSINKIKESFHQRKWGKLSLS